MSTLAILEERGVLTAEEIDAAIGPGRGASFTSGTPDFSAGDEVLVVSEDVGVTRWRKPHIRTPGYLFGCTGVVERYCGLGEDAELAAFPRGRPQPAPTQPVYRVRFRSTDVWANAGLRYGGEDKDTIEVEVYQPWLTPKPADFKPRTPATLVDGTAFGASCPVPASDAEHNHNHDDDDDDHHHHGDHVHESRSVVEQRAVDREGLEPRFKQFAEGLIDLLVKKGIVSMDDVLAGCAAQQETLGRALGPAIVARAWIKPAFKAALLEDANAAVFSEFGIHASNPAAPTQLCILPNSDKLWHLVCCTLCSCYPQAILGELSLFWRCCCVWLPC